ncbi:FecR domain-containing protein [Variovorax sp. EBFNA2]|uniref:FecR family protein n=1 Tax=Variovorax sp. EBFNA2 TaxID=3342097 RepID=UPI0029C02E8F|nr:FecR domain-containing protein [Variovorax boronicumulans]WPG40667.1 FecR domain-containing protein [Variovorax boronicumulans]
MHDPLMASADDPALAADTTRHEAWEWLRLFHSGAVKPQDAQRFKHWLARSPVHASVFREAKAQWAVLGPASAAVLRSNAEAAAFHARHRTRPVLARRGFLGAAAGAAAMAGVAGVAVFHPSAGLWPAPSGWGSDYRTATGEQLEVGLTDRVQVTLNTQTRIRRRTVDGRTTGVDLLEGEAAFDLSSGSGARPFGVVAGAGRSLAESGRFEVRYLDAKVCVTCIEGAVRVEHPAGARELRARQQTVYDGTSVSSVALVGAANLSAWRKGELVFTQARLSDVLDEINRYRRGRVVLMNTAARSRLVTGSFYIASLDLALAQLQHAFDLDARSLPGGLTVLS